MVGRRERPATLPGQSSPADDARARAEAMAAAERRIAERFARLHATTAALSAALTTDQVAAAIAWRGSSLPGATGCAVVVLPAPATPGAPLPVAAAQGEVARLTGGAGAVPLGADLPLAVAVRERRPLFAGGEPPAVAASFGFVGSPSGGVAALPLEAGDRVLGAVGVELAGPFVLDGEERAFLKAFAHACGQALERARLYEAERAARLEAQRAEEAARRAVEMEERLAGIVGHDLRTPLAAITMSAGMLLRRDGLGEEQRRMLSRIAGSAARMARIIRDLLDFTRIRNEGAIPIQARPVDLVQLAERALAELAEVHPGRVIRVQGEASAVVRADPDRLGQVISNLGGNALQHSPPDAAVRVSVSREGETVALRVHNGGPPIAADLVPELFEPFRRGRTGGEGGSLGLGLFIVREVVRAHGGSVEVASSAEEGTTFTVRLPSLARRAEASCEGAAPER